MVTKMVVWIVRIIVWNISIVIKSVKMVIRMLEMVVMKIFDIEIRYQFNWMNKVSPTWDALRSCFWVTLHPWGCWFYIR